MHGVGEFQISRDPREGWRGNDGLLTVDQDFHLLGGRACVFCKRCDQRVDQRVVIFIRRDLRRERDGHGFLRACGCKLIAQKLPKGIGHGINTDRRLLLDVIAHDLYLIVYLVEMLPRFKHVCRATGQIDALTLLRATVVDVIDPDGFG